MILLFFVFSLLSLRYSGEQMNIFHVTSLQLPYSIPRKLLINHTQVVTGQVPGSLVADRIVR